MIDVARNEGSGNASITRLVEIVRDHGASRVGVPREITSVDLAQFFNQKHPTNMVPKNAAEAVADFFLDR